MSRYLLLVLICLLLLSVFVWTVRKLLRHPNSRPSVIFIVGGSLLVFEGLILVVTLSALCMLPEARCRKDAVDILRTFVAPGDLEQRLAVVDEETKVLDGEMAIVGRGNIRRWLEAEPVADDVSVEEPASTEQADHTLEVTRTTQHLATIRPVVATLKGEAIATIKYGDVKKGLASTDCASHGNYPPLPGLVDFHKGVADAGACPSVMFPLRHLREDEATIKTYAQQRVDRPATLTFEIDGGRWVRADLKPPTSQDVFRLVQESPSVELSSLAITGSTQDDKVDLEVRFDDPPKQDLDDPACFRRLLLTNKGPAALTLSAAIPLVRFEFAAGDTITIMGARMPSVILPGHAIDLQELGHDNRYGEPFEMGNQEMRIVVDPLRHFKDTNLANNSVRGYLPKCKVIAVSAK